MGMKIIYNHNIRGNTEDFVVQSNLLKIIIEINNFCVDQKIFPKNAQKTIRYTRKKRQYQNSLK